MADTPKYKVGQRVILKSVICKEIPVMLTTVTRFKWFVGKCADGRDYIGWVYGIDPVPEGQDPRSLTVEGRLNPLPPKSELSFKDLMESLIKQPETV